MTLQAGNNVAPTYQDPTKLSFGSGSEKYCITCGKSENVNQCARCKGAWYCDSNCQQADWPCHKLLCAKYAKLNESEPIKNGYRAFLFRADSFEPELLVLPVTWRGKRDFKPIISLLRQEESMFDDSVQLPGFGFNMRLKMPYIYAGKTSLRIEVACRESHGFDGSPPNKSIFASVKAIGKKPGHLWAGNIVVRREHDSFNGLRAGSVTMADFRHTVDWFAFYPKMAGLDDWDSNPPVSSPWSAVTFPGIQGILIKGDQEIKDESERYTTVTVPASHPIRGIMPQSCGDISPISKRVGRALRLVMRLDEAYKVDANHTPPACGPAKDLMRPIEKDTNFVLPGVIYSSPCRGFPPMGQVLVIRADDKDLSIDDVRAMVYFSDSMCRAGLRKIAIASREAKPDLRDAMKSAKGLMTWDNYVLEFDKLGLPRPQRPAEEAFIDMRGPDAPDDVDHGGDEDDGWNDGWDSNYDESYEDESDEDESDEDESDEGESDD